MIDWAALLLVAFGIMLGAIGTCGLLWLFRRGARRDDSREIKDLRRRVEYWRTASTEHARLNATFATDAKYLLGQAEVALKPKSGEEASGLARAIGIFLDEQHVRDQQNAQ